MLGSSFILGSISVVAVGTAHVNVVHSMIKWLIKLLVRKVIDCRSLVCHLRVSCTLFRSLFLVLKPLNPDGLVVTCFLIFGGCEGSIRLSVTR
jgi:hypothetical protein